MRRRTLLTGVAAAAAVPTVVGCSSDSGETQANGTQLSAQGGHIGEATAITEVFGDGQKLTAVALKFPKDIDRGKLALSTFKVGGRTVTNVYANTEAAKAGHGANGPYVIVELSPADPTAAVYSGTFTAPWTATPATATASPSPSASASTAPSGPPSSSSSQKQGGMSSSSALKTTPAKITQTLAVTTTDGDVYAASSTEVETSKFDNLIVDDFEQLKYTDAETQGRVGRPVDRLGIRPPGRRDERQGPPVNFVALKNGTVVWPGLSDDSGSNHICTWRAAYTIEGIRDWLFQQKK